jgi:hypothetical protein
VRRSGVALALVLSGCLEPSSLVCADGTVCAADLVCAPVAGCATPDQVAACDGAAAGDACSVGDVPGMCQDGVCRALVCGDGLVSVNEQCDASAGDQTTTCRERGFYQGGSVGCAADCTWNVASCSEFCGDGILQGREELCETGIEPDGTCVSFGFDAGRLGCAGCGVDFAACRVIGWTDATIDAGVGLSVASIADAGDSIIAVGTSSDDGAPFAARWRGTWSLLGTLDADLQPMAVWARDADHVWMTGALLSSGAGFAAYWDGTDWTVDDLPEPGNAIWSDGSAVVFVLSGNGVRTWDGNAWSYTELSDAFYGGALAGTAGGVVYAAGGMAGIYRFDGAWEPMEAPPGLEVTDLVTDQDGAPIAATLFGGVYRWDGDTWVDLGLPVVPEDGLLWIDEDGRLFALARWSGPAASAQFTVFHLRAGTWRVLSDSIDNSLRDVLTRGFGGFGHQLFLFADYRGFQYGGAAWWDLSPATVNRAADMWSNGEVAVLVAASRVVHVHDADGWYSTGLTGDKVDGAGDDVYVLDMASSQIHHRNPAGTWTTSDLEVDQPADIAVRGPDDVFVIGSNNFELDHWDGSTAAEIFSPNSYIAAVDCGDDGTCAAVGDPGSFWSNEKVPAPPGRNLFAVWVAPDGTMVAGGDFGGLWLYDGAWEPMKNAESDAINVIGGSSAHDLFASGGSDLLYYDGGEDLAWQPVRLDDQDASITALAPAGDGLLVGGDHPALVRLERTEPW